MARTLRIVESAPASRPAVTGLSPAAAALPAEVVWRRLESWCAHRWGVRDATFIVDGCGPWEPPLRPWTLTAAERWVQGEWVPADPAASPYGFDIHGGPWRFMATVGEATAPADVLEAFRRLAEYSAQASAEIAAGQAANTSGRDGDYGYARPTGWAARALHLSGATDLLRPWRHMQ